MEHNITGYTRRACRCEICTAAIREYINAYRKLNPEFTAAHNARQRCTNPKNPKWDDYGGRGIRYLLNSWKDIVEAIGKRPTGLELDRIDNDGHYEIGNLRWATRSQNLRNRRKVTA